MNSTAIGDQIDRILRSQSFASKPQLRKLLEVLFKNMDSQSTLTPSRVIKELWPDEIRTKRSADVATEMNRLRHALESYYNGEGKTDPITICLPNRAVTAPGGTYETRWIVARPRERETAGLQPASEDQRPIPQVSARRGLKLVAAIAANRHPSPGGARKRRKIHVLSQLSDDHRLRRRRPRAASSAEQQRLEVHRSFRRDVAVGKGKKAKTNKQTLWCIRADVVRKLDRGEPEPETLASGSAASSEALDASDPAPFYRSSF